MHSGRDPTVVVGTKLKELDGRNWRVGRGDTFLLEACEYRNSFHHYDPSIILLTTCDGDHFDFYSSMDDYRRSFIEFIQRLPADGIVITHLSDPDCAAVAQASGRRVIDADAEPLITLRTPGAHMQRNAQLVLALARHLSIPEKQAQAALSGYAGSWRRLELKGMFKDDIPVIDDYAHHPREIRASLDAIIGEYPDKRVVCVFQPHTHDRTLKLYEDFTHCFRGAGLVIVSDVYEARKDIETERVKMPQFVIDVQKGSDVKAVGGGSLGDIATMLRQEILKSGDVLLCMGAGDSTKLTEEMVTSPAYL